MYRIYSVHGIYIKEQLKAQRTKLELLTNYNCGYLRKSSFDCTIIVCVYVNICVQRT